MQWLEGRGGASASRRVRMAGGYAAIIPAGTVAIFASAQGVLRGKTLKLLLALTACTSRRMNSEGGSCFADFAARERKRKAKPGKPRTGGAAACSKPQNPALCAQEGDGPCAYGRTLCSLVRTGGKEQMEKCEIPVDIRK